MYASVSIINCYQPTATRYASLGTFLKNIITQMTEPLIFLIKVVVIFEICFFAKCSVTSAVEPLLDYINLT